MTLSLISLIIIIFIPLYCIYTNNSIIKNHNRVRQAWADVITQQRQKSLIIPKIESLVKEHKEFESLTLLDLTQMRSAAVKLTDLPSNITSHDLDNFQHHFQHMLKNMNVVVENYPELKSIDLYCNLANEISNQEDNVGAAIRVYNSNVATFNSCIEVFPNHYINKVFTKKRLATPFEHKTSSSEIGFTPTF
ncbi:LemA family protein [Proteus sp. ZN5]|uniref:LemA family protein n=1 Tax=Proteus sp. ZN5 TaxID=2697019 RepID=UPI0013E12F0A|nr:LemA family protein [Proteus sp. ZN5]QIG06055.1 LemA family protein [Proteus sp. ZN5]